ncbi:UNVERIFIED_CONTAM: hypothetical protein K2H54_055410 [Gekko kuhli]
MNIPRYSQGSLSNRAALAMCHQMAQNVGKLYVSLDDGTMVLWTQVVLGRACYGEQELAKEQGTEKVELSTSTRHGAEAIKGKEAKMEGVWLEEEGTVAEAERGNQANQEEKVEEAAAREGEEAGYCIVVILPCDTLYIQVGEQHLQMLGLVNFQ